MFLNIIVSIGYVFVLTNWKHKYDLMNWPLQGPRRNFEIGRGGHISDSMFGGGRGGGARHFFLLAL